MPKAVGAIPLAETSIDDSSWECADCPEQFIFLNRYIEHARSEHWNDPNLALPAQED